MKTEKREITVLPFEIPDEYDRLGKDEEQVDEEDGVEVKDQAVEVVAHLKELMQTPITKLVND